MEAFDVEDEEAAAVWDLDDLEVERLRAAPSLSQGGSGVSGLLGGPRGARDSDAAGGLQQQQQEDGGEWAHGVSGVAWVVLGRREAWQRGLPVTAHSAAAAEPWALIHSPCR
jgi:hypothetical protein